MIECIYHVIEPDSPLPRHWLMPDELQYLDGVSSKRQYEFCYGRALVRSYLCTQRQIPFHDVIISLPAGTAPVLSVAGLDYHLSISHSGNAIGVAIGVANGVAIGGAVSADQAVGLDIERMKKRRYLSDFYKQFGIFKEVPKSLVDFYQTWTAGEAYSKLSGTPLLQVLAEPLPTQLLRKYRQLDDIMLCLCYRKPANINWHLIAQLPGR